MHRLTPRVPWMPWRLCRATAAERCRSLAGDGMVAQPAVRITHAITIAAPPEQVWPWLVQMGCDRAGWYSYDHLDNAGRRSATAIHAEWQQVAVGDVLPAAPGLRTAFVVVDIVPGHRLLLGVLPAERQTANSEQERSPASTPGYLGSWCLVLQAMPAQHTRLLTRGQVDRRLLSPPTLRTPLFAPFTTPSELLYRIPFPLSVARIVAHLVHFVMEQRMLTGIKWRAETQSGRATSKPLAGASAPQ